MPGYTAPERLVLPEVLLRKTRRLPRDGQVTARVGDPVRPTDVVARTQRPGEPVVVMVGQALRVPPQSVTRLLRRWAGEAVQRDEILAVKKGPLGLRRRVCRSPIDGAVISGPHSAGEVVIGAPDEELQLRAALPGRVVATIPFRGVVIETLASYVQGIGGYGDEVGAPLWPLVTALDGEILPDMIVEKAAGVVLAGGHIGQEALAKAARIGVAGVVVGGIAGAAYRWLLANRPALTLLITGGAGAVPMAPETFQLLQRRAGGPALLNGTPGPDAGPELILPLPGPLKALPMPRVEFAVGASVRIVSGRWAGHRGRIAALSLMPRRLSIGITTPVVSLELEDGQTATVPCGNVTLIA